MDPEKIAKEPIAGNNPAGMDASYEPEFEQIQAEIDKLSSPTASGQVDWKKVSQLGQTILAEKSKDLKVAGYLAVALMHTDKIAGLADGLSVMRALLEEFWDSLWPKKKRMRGRLGALNWWLEKTQDQLEKLSNTTIEAETVSALKDNLVKIDEILADKMPDPPLVRPLIRLVESLPVKQEKKPEPPPAAEAQATPSPKPAARPAPKPAAPAEPDKIETEKDARKAVGAALQKIQQAAGFLLENDLSDPTAYALRRIACWSRVVDLPPSTEGRTQIPAPPPQVGQELEQLQADGKWEALVITCEKRLSQFIFWFDLNRMAAEALASMGARYQAASDTICQQAAFLAARLEGIQDLAFADGTSFADAQTKAWLQASGIAAGTASGTGTGAGVAEQGSDSEAEVLDKARKLIKKRKLAQAMQLIREQMIRSFGLREQFRWRLIIARLLMEAKKAKLARPQLEKILETIERFDLENWEPALALEGLTIAMAGFKATADKEIRARCDDLLMRIAAIDPAAALAAG